MSDKEEIEKAINDILEKLGVDVNDRDATRRDFMRLREWRKNMDILQSHGMLTILGLTLSGILVALWMGLKGLLK